MSIKDQIRDEIKRLANVNKQCGSRPFTEGIAAGYADVLRFLDTLPEQPVEGLEEEEIDNAIYGIFYAHCRVAAGEFPDRETGVYIQIKEGSPWIPVNDWKHPRFIATDDTIKRIARHFYELGNARKEQNVSAVEVLTRAGLKPFKDGNKWCIIAGDDIQEGICGFGDTVEEALYEFLMEVVAVQKKMLAKPVVGEFHIEDENHSWIDFNKKLLFDEGENVVVSVLSLKK